jgi:hypothetical protein
MAGESIIIKVPKDTNNPPSHKKGYVELSTFHILDKSVFQQRLPFITGTRAVEKHMKAYQTYSTPSESVTLNWAHTFKDNPSIVEDTYRINTGIILLKYS